MRLDRDGGSLSKEWSQIRSQSQIESRSRFLKRFLLNLTFNCLQLSAPYTTVALNDLFGYKWVWENEDNQVFNSIHLGLDGVGIGLEVELQCETCARRVLRPLDLDIVACVVVESSEHRAIRAGKYGTFIKSHFFGPASIEITFRNKAKVCVFKHSELTRSYRCWFLEKFHPLGKAGREVRSRSDWNRIFWLF